MDYLGNRFTEKMFPDEDGKVTFQEAEVLSNDEVLVSVILDHNRIEIYHVDLNLRKVEKI
jgi:hypothetical protein